MSTTITQTEQRTAMIEKSPIFEAKRSTFIRTTSMEKLKRFNNFFCSQHYYLLPAILLWLKTSLLKSTLEKCLNHIKTITYVLIVRDMLQERISSATKATTRNLRNVYERLNNYFHILYEQFKRFLLISFVYLGVIAITVHALGCVYFIGSYLPPVGFFFLVTCLVVMAGIKYKILRKKMEQVDVKSNGHVKKIVYKNISKVKLF